MGEQNHKDSLDNGNANNPPNPPDEVPELEIQADEDESEEFTMAEYQSLNNQLDALFTALDDIESKNDNIHAQLLQLLKANREIRAQLNEAPEENVEESN